MMMMIMMMMMNYLSDFTLKIKSWIPGGCPCNLCRGYICQVGYIN